jgi:lipopolysaccharide biosynthesis glycosyltransferase
VNGNDYVCPEQDLLNRIFDNKQNLDDCYNYTPRNIFQPKIKIVHFAGPSKPNKVEDFVLLLDNKIYLEYFSYIRKYKNKISEHFFKEVENKINNFYEFVKINNIDLCNILKVK